MGKTRGKSPCLLGWGAIKSASQDARKRRTNDESIWSAATCRRFPTDTEYHSGDKSPHSKRAVIVQLHLTKAEPEATRTSNYTRGGRRGCLGRGGRVSCLVRSAGEILIE